VAACAARYGRVGQLGMGHDGTCFHIWAAISYLQLNCGLMWWLRDLACGNNCFSYFFTYWIVKYSCLYNTCVNINLFLCICRDGFWFLRTLGTSFRGFIMMSMTLLLPRLWANGNLPGALLILDTTEMPFIRWTILMSPWSCTRDDDTSRPFRTYVGTLNGSWPTKTRGYGTCQSRFLGSTVMSILFPGFLQTLGLLRQGTWLWPSCSLLYMSSASKRGVIWFRIRSRGLIRGGTWDGSIEYQSYCEPPCGHSLLHNSCPSSSCPSLRGGYCSTVVGHTSSRSIPGHRQHERQSGACNGDSRGGFKSTLLQHFGGSPVRLYRVWPGVN